jgi:hypothetical protein
MSRLYICNTSKQHVDFTYKIPGESTFRLETIKAGSQTMLPFDMDELLVAEILKQHAPYHPPSGLRDANSLSNVKEYVGLCYSIDKPVPLDNLLYLFETNGPKLNERAKDLREKTAVATASVIKDKMSEMGIDVTGAEVTMEEDVRGPKSINEGYEVGIVGTSVSTPSRHNAQPSRRAGRR